MRLLWPWAFVVLGFVAVSSIAVHDDQSETTARGWRALAGVERGGAQFRGDAALLPIALHGLAAHPDPELAAALVVVSDPLPTAG